MKTLYGPSTWQHFGRDCAVWLTGQQASARQHLLAADKPEELASAMKDLETAKLALIKARKGDDAAAIDKAEKAQDKAREAQSAPALHLEREFGLQGRRRNSRLMATWIVAPESCARRPPPAPTPAEIPPRPKKARAEAERRRKPKPRRRQSGSEAEAEAKRKSGGKG